MSMDFEADVRAFRLKVLQLAQHEDVAADILVAALSDVLGHTAALLDRTMPMPVAERLQSVNARVLQAHGRAQGMTVRAV